MSSISGKFLGRPVSLPGSILSFLEYDRFSADVMSKALELVLDKMNQCKTKSAESCLIEMEESRKPYQELLLKLSEQYVTKLISYGIYDVSADSMIAKTEIYDDLDALISEMMKHHVETAKKILSSSINALQSAYQQAGNSITGSGVSVYTSSAATLIASGIFESSVLKSQAKRADAQFREAAATIGDQNDDAMSREDARALYDDFFPKFSNLALDCCRRLYSQFLTVMTSHGKFDFESVEHYDLSMAREMLKNLDLVPDKTSLLLQCFDACPYCEELYERVFELGLLDIDTFRIAERMGLTGGFEGQLTQKCRELAGDSETFHRYLAIVARSHAVDTSTALREVFETDLAKAAESYSKMMAASNSDSSMSLWLKSSAELSDAYSLCSLDEQAVNDIIDKAMSEIRMIAKRCRFVEMNLAVHPDESCRALWKGILDDGNAQIKNLAKQTLRYADRLKPHVQACAECADQLHSEIDVRRAKLQELHGKLLARLKEKKEDLKTSSLVNVSGRARISDEIDKLNWALNTIEQRFSLPQLRNALDEVSKEGASIDIQYLDMNPSSSTPCVEDAIKLISSRENVSDIESLLPEFKSEGKSGKHFHATKKRRGMKDGDQLNIITLILFLLLFLFTMQLVTGGNVSRYLNSSAAAGALMVSYAAAAIISVFIRSKLKAVADWSADSKSSQVVRWVLVLGALFFILIVPMLSSCS